MLRGEHVMARPSRGYLIPHRLPHDGGARGERALEVAGKLIGIYASNSGGPRFGLERELSEAEEELGPRLDARRGFRIVRALAKLLEERAQWAAPTASDPYTVRTRVFELAAALPELPSEDPGLLDAASRDDVLSQVSRETGLEDPAALMYADRQSAQILDEFDEPSPHDLINRYNTAQAQGVLYSARQMVVDLGGEADARTIFRYVKLLGLIYRLETTPNGYRLHLDGPLSLFGGTRKYGLRLAKFLPALLLSGSWKLSADVTWKGRESILELDSETCGLEGHYADTKNEEHEEMREAFRRAWERAKDTGGWRLEPDTSILALPGTKTALVPDFTLKDPSSGEAVYLEILSFWSERHLMERAELLREAAGRGHRLLVAASEKLGASPEALSEASKSGVIPFKGRLAVKDVLESL